MSNSLSPFPTIDAVGRSLLKSIEIENGLPAGVFDHNDPAGQSEYIFSDFDVHDLRLSVDQTIDLLRRRLNHFVIFELRRRHNSLLPIHRLTPKVLSLIFELALSSVDPDWNLKRLLQISSICHMWRTVAIWTPSLLGVIGSRFREDYIGHSGLLELRRRHNSLLPIHRLPLEILSAIVEFALSSIHADYRLQRLLQISSVCFTWRTVAIATPSLWSTISSRNTTNTITLALERSKDAPLSAWFIVGDYSTNLDGYSEYLDTRCSDNFLDFIYPHKHRWCVVSLQNMGCSTALRMLNERGVHLSGHLQQLNITWAGSPSDGDLVPFFGVAEQLVELQLRNLLVSRDDILRILSTSPKLTSLHLESLLVQNVEDGTATDSQNSCSGFPDIRLPCLTTLKLIRIPSILMTSIMKTVETCGLRNVEIVLDTGVPENALEDSNHAPSYTEIEAFIPRLIEASNTLWFRVKLLSDGLSFDPLCTTPACAFNVKLIGSYSTLLPWLRLRLLPLETHSYELDFSHERGEELEQVDVANLVRLHKLGSVVLKGAMESWRWIWMLSLPDAVEVEDVDAMDWEGKTKRSWVWPGLLYLNFHGDSVDEFTTLGMLSARYGNRRPGAGETNVENGKVSLTRLISLEVHPGDKIWRPEVLDRIREVVGPGVFKWQTS
ncbi:hypothetical protein FRB90_001892 [Tulasnella sp. 427]|nr:hypothetical protein FRB90_001892 [Tulasnella sp. 427]